MANKDIIRAEPTYYWTPYPKRPDLEMCVVSVPGFVDPGPRDGSWCGVHGMELHWILRGPLGAVMWYVSTDWIPERVGESYGPELNDGRGLPRLFPRGGTLTYHARSFQTVEWYDAEGEYAPSRTDCKLLGDETAACWAGYTSYHEGNQLLEKYVKSGDSVVWDALEEIYDSLKDSGINEKTWKQHRKAYLQKVADEFEVN